MFTLLIKKQHIYMLFRPETKYLLHELKQDLCHDIAYLFILLLNYVEI